MKYIITLLLSLLLLFSFAACSSAPEEENPEEIITEEIITEADPQAAINEIYADFDRTSGLVNATYIEMKDVMGFNMDQIEEFHVRYMETDFGASDVYIIKAKSGMENDVRQSLKNWQETRIRSFNGYDIYNSTEISENAVIFQRGEYLVMLMLEDNDAARAIIETYIPEELNLD